MRSAAARGVFPMLNKAGEQEQEVLTPPEIIAAIVATWGAGIALDPCAPDRPPAFRAERSVRYGWGPSGLGGLEPDLIWPDRTFVNPPFDDLRPWLEKACDLGRSEGLGHWRRIVVLCPLRSHRPWFRAAVAAASASGDPGHARGGLTLLPGIRFVGHKSIFPAPLCLISWGCLIAFPDSLICSPERTSAP